MSMQKNCTWIFIENLFVVAKTWKQLRYPMVGGGVNKQ